MICIKKAAKLKGVSDTRMRQLCRDDRITPKPKRIGRDWVLADTFEVIEAGRTRPGKILMVEKKGRKK